MRPTDDDVAQLLLQATQLLAEARKLATRAGVLKRGHDKRLRQALGHIYRLGQKLSAFGETQAFVIAQGRTWGKVAQGNPFHPLCSLAFQDTTEATDISKYAAVLAFAEKLGVPADHFEHWLAGFGVANAYDAARADSTDKHDEHMETDKARLARALAALDGITLGDAQNFDLGVIPSLLDVSGEEGLQHLRKAIVDVSNNAVQVVKILPSTTEDLARDIRSTVSPLGTHSGRSLSDKPLYDLFRACDYHVRLTPQAEGPSPSFRDIPEPDDLDYEAWAASFETAKAQPLWKPPAVQRGIRLYYAHGGWVAESVSTALAFAGFRVRLSSLPPDIDADKEFLISDKQAQKFAAGFKAPGDWSIALRKPGALAEDDQLLLDRFCTSSDIDWRVPIEPSPVSPLVSITHFSLMGAVAWLASLGSDTGTKLPKVLALRWVHGCLTLVAPACAKLDCVPQTQQRTLSSMAEGISDGLLPPDRWLLSSDLRWLAEFGQLYGTPLQMALGEGVEGIASINLVAQGGVIVIPLAVTLTGEYAEMVEPIRSEPALSPDVGERQ